MGGAPTAFSNRSRASGGGRGGPGAGGRGAAAPAGAGPAGAASGRAAGGGGGRAAGGAGSFDIVEHCRKLGMYGVQTNPPSDPAELKKFRARLDSYQMTLVCDPRLPQDASGVADFEAQVKAFKEAGAVAFHAAMTGRRYEDMASPEAFRANFERNQKSVELAAPILNKYRVPMGIENHKGWRSAEQAAWLKRIGSEYVGVCLDFGNNLSLCELPEDTLRILGPLTVFGHIKDMAVQEYEDGFLLSEVPFGEGIIDLKLWVDTLRKKDPKMQIYLEMITRDPLKIPIYTDSYYKSFDESYSALPARDVARVIKLVKTRGSKTPLPKTTGLGVEEAAKLEDDLNLKCVEWGRKNLAL
jgi:3-oxoisoapionate decarboxylase